MIAGKPAGLAPVVRGGGDVLDKGNSGSGVQVASGESIDLLPALASAQWSTHVGRTRVSWTLQSYGVDIGVVRPLRLKHV